MIDGERHIRLRNAAAAALLARRDLLQDMDGVLACRDAESERRVSSALRALAAGGDRRAVWLRGSDGRSGAAVLHALRDRARRDRPRDRVLVIVVEKGEPPGIDVQLLAHAYGLTSTEARVACLIATGHSTERCARELGVKTSTLRSHLGAIYRKTGATDKADLVRLVLSLHAV